MPRKPNQAEEDFSCCDKARQLIHNGVISPFYTSDVKTTSCPFGCKSFVAKNFESVYFHLVNKKFNNPQDYMRFEKSIYNNRDFLDFIASCFRVGDISTERLNAFFHCLRKVESRVGTPFNIMKRKVTYANRKAQTLAPQPIPRGVDIRNCDIAFEGLEFKLQPTGDRVQLDKNNGAVQVIFDATLNQGGDDAEQALLDNIFNNAYQCSRGVQGNNAHAPYIRMYKNAQ